MMRYGQIGAGVAVAVLLAATPASAEPNGKTCDRANFRVIVDVGHTVDSPGAMSARGATEYSFNLRLAMQIQKSLHDAGFPKTNLLIVNGRAIRSMYERVARANAIGADLLLSVHHDAVPDSFLEKWEFEGKQLFFSDRFSGYSLFVADGNSDRKASLRFGHLLGEELKAKGLTFTSHYTETFMGRFRRTLLDAIAGVYRYDTLYLLKKSRAPAVLLEAGSIVNRDEELLLASPERQAQITAAVIKAVEDFCAAPAQRPSTQVAHARPRHPHRRAGRAQAAEMTTANALP